MPVQRVQSATQATSATVQPLQKIREEFEPVGAASFEKDVKPFADGIAISFALTLTGIGFFVVFLWISGDYPQIQLAKYGVIPIAVIVTMVGLVRLFVQIFLLGNYLERQWKTKSNVEEFQDGVVGEVNENTIWMALDNRNSIMFPTAPYPEAYADFATDYLAGRALFSELGSQDKKGANNYGFSTNDYNDFRDIMLRNNLAVWRNPNHTQQGVALTPRGDRVMAELANSGPAALEQFLTNQE